MFKLSPRIQTIFDHLIPGKPVWDFCCDHGYLGLAAYRSSYFPEVHFVDQVASIMERLEGRFLSKHYRPEYAARAFFYTQSGESIAAPLQGTVVISGVGAFTILDILKGRDLKQCERVILLPQKDEDFLLQTLQSDPIFIATHSLQKDFNVDENNRVRRVLIFDKMTQP